MDNIKAITPDTSGPDPSRPDTSKPGTPVASPHPLIGSQSGGEPQSGRKQALLDSGSVVLNALVAGAGIPRGILIELAGGPGTGKSLGLLHICKAACERGESVLYLDVDCGVNESQLRGVGLLPFYARNDPGAASPAALSPASLFQWLQPDSLEALDEILGLSVKLDNPPAIIVIDSITSAQPASLLENPVEEFDGEGRRHKLVSVLLQKYKPRWTKQGTTVFLANQMRMEMGEERRKDTTAFGGAVVKPAGERPLEHFCDVRLLLDELSQPKTAPSDKASGAKASGAEVAPQGYTVRVQATKNRFAAPHQPMTLAMRYGRGFWNERAYFEWLLQQGMIHQERAYFTVRLPHAEPVKLKGRQQVEDYIRRHSEAIRAVLTEARREPA